MLPRPKRHPTGTVVDQLAGGTRAPAFMSIPAASVTCTAILCSPSTCGRIGQITFASSRTAFVQRLVVQRSITDNQPNSTRRNGVRSPSEEPQLWKSRPLMTVGVVGHCRVTVSPFNEFEVRSRTTVVFRIVRCWMLELMSNLERPALDPRIDGHRRTGHIHVASRAGEKHYDPVCSSISARISTRQFRLHPAWTESFSQLLTLGNRADGLDGRRQFPPQCPGRAHHRMRWQLLRILVARPFRRQLPLELHSLGHARSHQ